MRLVHDGLLRAIPRPSNDFSRTRHHGIDIIASSPGAAMSSGPAKHLEETSTLVNRARARPTQRTESCAVRRGSEQAEPRGPEVMRWTAFPSVM
ncbi:Hypothetical protein A7982_02032 [Minicystis rosea]|nr:Hypothetical protein A7982_02032 [Minicystis rosea]